MGTIKTKRPVALDHMPYAEWAMSGHKIRAAIGLWSFEFGDWLNHGEATYGELYAQAADETGYRLESLQTFQRVSRAIPESIRRLDKLTYGHHVLVSAHRYPIEEKVQWLELAIAKGWNVREMREAIKANVTR